MTSEEQQQNKAESKTMNLTNESDRVREIKRAGQHSRTSERPSTSTISSRLLAPTAASRARVAATLNNSNEPEKQEQKAHVRKQDSVPSVSRQRQSTSRRTTSLQSSSSSASSTASKRPPSYAAPTRSSLMRSGSLSTSTTTTRPIMRKKNPEQKSAVLSDNQATPISPHNPAVSKTSSIQHPPTKESEEGSSRLDWEEKLAVLAKEASEKDKAIADLEARLAALEEELRKALSLNKEKDARIENLEHEISYSPQMERSTSSESSKSSRKSLSTGVDVANIVKKLDHQSNATVQGNVQTPPPLAKARPKSRPSEDDTTLIRLRNEELESQTAKLQSNAEFMARELQAASNVIQSLEGELREREDRIESMAEEITHLKEPVNVQPSDTTQSVSVEEPGGLSLSEEDETPPSIDPVIEQPVGAEDTATFEIEGVTLD